MTEIICPYDGDCGRHFDPGAMDAPDGAFLTTAIAKKMTFMFLHCPACTRMFPFNPVAWTAQACEAAAPEAARVAKKSGKQLEGFAQALAQAAGTGSKQAAPFCPAELEACLSIGEENTRILFIDSRGNEALWIYHPDGGDVDKTRLTVTSLIGPCAP